MFEIKLYVSATGACPYEAWLSGLAPVVAQRIQRIVMRMALGNFGDSKKLRGAPGVFELRMDFGPGYRVYYGLDGQTVVLLLSGGDKSTQSRDVALARSLWAQYVKERENNANN